MMDHGKKTPIRVLSQDSKIPEEKAKFRPPPKYGSSTSKATLEVPTNRRASSCFFTGGVNSAKSYPKVYEERKMKLVEMGNVKEKETTEGVHDFIKQVSDIIEKKSPFKESAVCPCPRENKKSVNSPVIDSIQFNGMARTVQEKKKKETESKISTEEFCKNLEKKLKAREKFISSLKRDSANIKRKLNRSKSFLKNREKRDKRREKDSSPESSTIEPKTVRSTGTENEEVNFILSVVPDTQETAKPTQKDVKRRRPSEIPLRKVRTDSSSRPKPRSMKQYLCEKNSNEVERSSPSADLSSGDKLSEEKENVDDRWQIAINVDLSCEKISIVGQETAESEDSKIEESNSKLDIICGSSELLELSSFLSQEVPEKKPSSFLGKKTKTTDIEKVKTSSFTVLTSNNTTLNRLESLHKKNVRSKEMSANKEKSAKVPSKKPLPIKSSFNLLKGKCSKSLSSRLSSKGNKPGLKTNFKRPKSYKEPHQEPENNWKLKRSHKSKAGPMGFDITEIEKAPKPGSRGQKKENHKKESLKTRKAKREECQQRSVKSTKEKLTPTSKEQVGTLEISRVDLDSRNQYPGVCETSKSLRDLPLVQVTSEQTLIACEKELENEIDPPPTPASDISYRRAREVHEVKEEAEAKEEAADAQAEDEEEDEWSSRTVIFDDKFNYDNYIWNRKGSERKNEIMSKKTEKAYADLPDSIEKLKRLSLVVKGKPLYIAKDETPEKLEESDPPTVKKRLKIDLRSANQILEENPEDVANEGRTHEKVSWRSAEKEVKVGKSGSSKWGTHSREVIDEPQPPNLAQQKPRQSCSIGAAKGARKKKIRSEAGDRSSASASSFFNPDMPLQSKTKTDTKVRSGLTKSSKREEKLDVFEDVAAINLKRRNSEPNSFKGFVWRCADITARDHKASVSSMTSSLRHLNTDEIDDFILWEAVPQRMTSCWEMSLYHFKRPWSVLSCSVFRDNRKSSTPGLILENLRNGGTLSARRFAANQSERTPCRKENAFDVEPSIAQKNIDIRNWLAALNFPTLPSTSTDAFSEGSFTTQVAVDGQNLNKMSPKRRKVLPNLKFSDEGSKNKNEESGTYRKSPKWDEEGLTDLVRRKSGGFVTSEQFLNSEQSTHRPNMTVNLCVYSKSNEESILVETADRNACEPRKYKSVEIASQPEVSISATIINSGPVVGDHLVEKNKPKEKLSQELATESNKGQSMKMQRRLMHSEVNIWKYLFLMTLFIIVGHYCYVNCYVCRS